jgi:hypothetical protein
MVHSFPSPIPTPAVIRALDLDTLIAETWDLVGRKVSKLAKFEEIYTPQAKASVFPWCWTRQLSRSSVYS